MEEIKEYFCAKCKEYTEHKQMTKSVWECVKCLKIYKHIKKTENTARRLLNEEYKNESVTRNN